MMRKTTLTQLDINQMQRLFCTEQKVEFVPTPEESILGFAQSTVGKLPINGLRHPPEANTNGWYLWCGEHYSPASDFFAPTHTRHIYDDYPTAKLLGLPPGYRFLLAGDYLDVWFDESLLRI